MGGETVSKGSWSSEAKVVSMKQCVEPESINAKKDEIVFIMSNETAIRKESGLVKADALSLISTVQWVSMQSPACTGFRGCPLFSWRRSIGGTHFGCSSLR